MDKRPIYKIYQEYCDGIFGKGVVKVKKSQNFSYILQQWAFPDEFVSFKEGFAKRLIRLKDRFEKTESYPFLLETVAMVADMSRGDKAFAKLAAWDIMWDVYAGKEMELGKKVERYATYGWSARREVQKDGYMPTHGLYFDMGIMGDTVGNVMEQVIVAAKSTAEVEEPCDIQAEYPWDDHEGIYYTASDDLYKELLFFLLEDGIEDEEEVKMQSKAVPQLSYTVSWEKPLDFEPTIYRPYRHAEKTRDLILKRFAKYLMKNELYMVVLVKPHYYRNLVKDFDRADETYYRALARRTFCGYKQDGRQMRDLNIEFQGSETVEEAAKKLTGILIIEDNIEEGTNKCHAFLNPNARQSHGVMREYLGALTMREEADGAFDDFQYDNY